MMNRILERLIRQPEPGEGGTYALVESFLQIVKRDFLAGRVGDLQPPQE